MIDLLVECAIFEVVDPVKGNLYQLSGVNIAELQVAEAKSAPTVAKSAGTGQQEIKLRLSEVVFVRNRMMYAKAALNARGLVHFGLRHIRMSAYPFALSRRC